jgi:RecB family exonuclease
VIERRQHRDRLAPVWVVVRTPIVGLSLRRRMAENGAFAAVRFSPLGALAELLAGIGPSVGGRRPLTTVALRASARVALAETPGLLGDVASHPSTEASLASTYRDLRHVHQPDLDRLARAGPRAHDVVQLVRRMRELLAPTFYDQADVLDDAIARLTDGVESAWPELADIGEVVLYLPDPLATREITLLAALSRRLCVSVLAGRCGDELADRSINRFVEALAAAFDLGTDDDPRTGAGRERGGAALGSLGTVLSAPDYDVEVREAVRRLITHAETGGDLGRCIVSFPDGRRAAELGARVRAQLDVAGIPSNGEVLAPLRATPEAKLLTGLVQLSLPAPPGQELDRGEVMAWLGGAPVDAGPGLTHGLPSVEIEGGVPVGEWDRCSQDAGVLSGLAGWRHRLGSYVQRLNDRQSAGLRALAASDLAVFIERLHALTSSVSSAQSWTALRQWADSALGALLAPGSVREALADGLADLDVLDALEPIGHLPPSERLRRFLAALEVAFDRPSGDRGRYGEGPTIGPLSAVAGAGSALALVLGCQEGELPSRQPDDPLVPRIERDRIGSLAQGEHADERARRHFVSLLTASQNAQVSFSRVDVRAGREVYPSTWTSELVGGHVIDVASFAGSVRRVACGTVPAADGADFELASLIGAETGSVGSWLDSLDADFGRRRASAVRRHEEGLGPYSGYVPEAGGRLDAWATTLSPTSLQSFAECPFRFFVDRRLRVTVLEAPERRLQIDARERGTLMHEVLESFFRPGDEPWSVAALDNQQLGRLRRIAGEQFERVETAGRTGKTIFWVTERSQILRDLERYVARDLASLIACGLSPVAVELTFGRDSPPLVVTAAGRDVQFSGSIDRVDHGPDGRLVVVDYKSGKSDRYKGISNEPLGKGRHLQLPIYAKAARQVFGPAADGAPVRAEYRFVQATAGYAVVPVELTDELDAELSSVLGTLVSTIDAGCFPPRPGNPVLSTHEHCRYCDFDALCTVDRAEIWDSSSTDGRMQAYTELVNGLLPAAAPGEAAR